jgi:hypothetical protein
MPSSITSSSEDGIPASEALQTLFFGTIPNKEITYFETYPPNIDLSTEDAPEKYGLQIDAKYYTTRNHIKVLDLITEGEIDGIVSGEWNPNGLVEGQIGYSGNVFQPYTETDSPFLRSVYLNDVPVLNANGNYNFQEFQGGYFEGNSVGLLPESGNLTLDSGFLSVGVDEATERYAQKVRAVSERLRGPDRGATESFYLPKVYRVLNKDLSSININIKLPNLSYFRVNTKTVTRTVEEEGVDIQKAFATDQHGEIVRTELMQIPLATTVTLQFLKRPVYESANTLESWQDAGKDDIKGLATSPQIWKKNIGVESPNNPTASGLIGWDFGVVRATEDSRHSYANNQTFIDSIVEISNSKLSYPNSALVALNFDAEYFSAIPTRAYDMRLQKVQVPIGYDPITKQHSTSWNGGFQSKKQWTDNPAWIFYDLITNKRYGLGRFARHIIIDKWTLWEISKYCDTMVQDGSGGLEPRFSCNVLINTRADAFKVLKDFASIFRSILYYSFNSLNMAIDKPKDPIYLFNNSNVTKGNFKYLTNALQTLPTVAVVRYNDKTNYYKPALEYIEDVDSIRKYGINEREVSAFGCTSKSQAIRMGRWILSTETTQSEMVQFTTGPEALLLRPGDIVRVNDKYRSTEVYEGRIKNINSIANGWVTLDQELPLSGSTNYTLNINTPTFFYDTSITEFTKTGSLEATGLMSSHVSGIDFDSNNTSKDVIGTGVGGVIYGTRVSGNFHIPANVNIPENTPYSITRNTVADRSSNLYSITSIGESNTYNYSVEALLYNSGKYDFIEKGIRTAAAPGVHATTAAPPGPLAIAATITDVAGTLGTQQIEVKVKPPTNIGTTMGYKIFFKTIDGTSTCSDSANLDAYDFAAGDLTGGVPHEKFEAGFLYPIVNAGGFAVDGDGYLTVKFNHIPGLNKRVYVTRVFAVNSVGIISADYKKEERCVTEHHPVKDVKIWGLRTTTGDPDSAQQETNVNVSAKKALFSTVDSKHFYLLWNSEWLANDILPGGVRYKVKIFPAGTTDYAGTSALGEFITNDTKNFAFTFSLNQNLPNGPFRDLDATVEAEEVESPNVSSSNSYDTSGEGWDVIEVHNPRPKDYNLTPRKEIGAIPGNTFASEAMTTTQYIDSNGALVLDIRSTNINDLAGGFIYVSKNPFNYRDFKENGSAYTPLDRPDLLGDGGKGSRLSAEEQLALANWEIIEIPFTSPDNDILSRPLQIFPNTSPAASGLADDFAYNYGNKYYMAVRFYDSFDKAYKKLEPARFYTDIYPILPLGFVRNTILRSDGSEPGWSDPANTCTYTGPYPVIDHPTESYAVNTSCKKKVLAQNYVLSQGTGTNSDPAPGGIPHTGLFLGHHEVADTYVDPQGSGFFSCPIYPSRFFSANSENPFKWWVRLNINGQWEGNGIEKIRILTAKDVWSLYNYKGFFEYICHFKEVDDSAGAYYVNHPDTHTTCRFRLGDMGSYSSSVGVYSVDSPNLIDSSSSSSVITGVRAGILAPVVNSQMERVWHHTNPSDTYYYDAFNAYDDNEFSEYYPYQDRLQSYNERNQAIAGKTRPNLGFRRFRIYFDSHHLPYSTDVSGLASYSIVGMNSWNGPYEGWKGNQASQLKESLIFSKAGSGVFPSYVQNFLQPGDLFENIPGLWNHHPAGFAQGFGGLIKTQRYFDVHMGRLIDDSYLTEAFFGVLTTNDYTDEMRSADLPVISASNATTLKGLGGGTKYPDGLQINEAPYWGEAFVTQPENDGVIDYMKGDNYDPTA